MTILQPFDFGKPLVDFYVHDYGNVQARYAINKSGDLITIFTLCYLDDEIKLWAMDCACKPASTPGEINNLTAKMLTPFIGKVTKIFYEEMFDNVNANEADAKAINDLLARKPE